MTESEVSQVLATLSARQSLAVSTLVTREPHRIALRDALLNAYRRLLADGSPTHHAECLAKELGAADPAHPHAPLLEQIVRLSRNGAAPGPRTIVRALRVTPD